MWGCSRCEWRVHLVFLGPYSRTPHPPANARPRLHAQDIIQKVAQLQLNIQAIVAHLPDEAHLMRLFKAFNFEPNSAVFQERGINVARFALLPQHVTKGVAAIAAIHAHAPQFGTGTGVIDVPAGGGAAAPAAAAAPGPAAP